MKPFQSTNLRRPALCPCIAELRRLGVADSNMAIANVPGAGNSLVLQSYGAERQV